MEIKILGFKARVEVIVISAIIGCLLCCHLLCGCATVEGMQVAGSAIGYNMAKGVHQDKYEKKADMLEMNGGGKIGPQVPLPEGQLFMWANNEFSGSKNKPKIVNSEDEDKIEMNDENNENLKDVDEIEMNEDKIVKCFDENDVLLGEMTLREARMAS